MNTREVKKRIEEFYNGETSAEEEQLLSDYFRSGDVEEELAGERELFLRLFSARPAAVPPGLERKLNERIDRLAAEEAGKATPKPRRGGRRMWIWTGSVAACLLLFVVAGDYVHKKKQMARVETATAGDEQKIKEAQEALTLLSVKFNHGVEQLAVVSTNLDKTSEILKNALNNVYLLK